ncbi:MAG: glycosyltransferase family 4 protein [Clostridia bacterium]|nr:glycosyltransferase family 4 protein [Clostridia bacterium]
MKKVLIIADEFPPVGGAGVQRTLKFTKYLQHFKYMPTVFTRDEYDISLKDESLLSEIPFNVEVIRTRPFDFLHQNNLISKIIYYKLLIPDGRFLWYFFSRKALLRQVKRVSPDILYSTSFPYSDHLLGLYVKKKMKNIKWVADFRDEWTNNPYFKYSKFRTSIEKKLEKKILANADSLITNTPYMRDNFIESYPFIKDKIAVIPNGYDQEDYHDMSLNHENNHIFTITYTGSLYGSRKPDSFLQALSSVKDKLPNMKVVFIGNIKSDQIKKLLSQLNLEDSVEFIPYLPHKECIKKLSSGHVSLLIEGKENIPFYTGKLFEYMYVSHPILAVIPENGAAADLIRETGTGLVCDCEDINAISSALIKLYGDWEKNVASVLRNESEIEKYSRKHLTEKLVDIFNSIL